MSVEISDKIVQCLHNFCLIKEITTMAYGHHGSDMQQSQQIQDIEIPVTHDAAKNRYIIKEQGS